VPDLGSPIAVAADHFVPQLLRVYPRILMGSKVLAAVLVLLLLGADSNARLICTASCMSSATVAGAAVHHHEMDSQSGAMRANEYSHHHGARCAECPPNVENQTSNCIRLAEVQALREGSFSLDTPTGVTPIPVNRSADGLALNSDCERHFLFADSAGNRSSGPHLLPLRI